LWDLNSENFQEKRRGTAAGGEKVLLNSKRKIYLGYHLHRFNPNVVENLNLLRKLKQYNLGVT
jgi:hypothetical protein